MHPRRSIASIVAAGALLAAPSTHALSPAADGVANPATAVGAGSPAKSAARRKADDLSRAFRDAARTLAPSVVTINTTSRSRAAAQPALPPGLRLPPGFSAPQAPEAGPARGTGTGVVISRDGYIVTANHVVDGADEIELVFRDGRTAKASVVGLDPGTDIAVLRTGESGLEPAAFGDSEDLEAGEWVVAIGAPFGLEQTVTAGIVSAKGRSDVGLAAFERYIQTDAAINPGNSGGPLANLDGEIVGINSAISSRGGGNDGIGFAVPSAVVRRVAESIIATGRVARGFLGVGVQPADARMLQGLGAEQGTGVLVNRVERGSPADKAGIEPGDVITSVAGRTVRTPGELVAAIGDAAPGAEIDLNALRGGDERTIRATLAERTDGPRDAGGGAAASPARLDRIGMTLRALGPDECAALGVESEGGALAVESVEPDGAAARSGIAAGDVLRRIGRATVETVEEARRALEAIAPSSAVPMLIEREGRTRFVLVAPAKSDTER